ncbi:MAG: OB-fold nucleic acid binding domain-containing protein, partial [bacterium]|nr:OB-fold nucleic acid binding domain-containing protein [bacterium]
MNTILISNLANSVDKEVTIKGWMYNKRSSGKIAFLQIRDGSGFTQAIVNRADVADDVWQGVEQLTDESSVVITGQVSKHPKKEEYELQVTALEIVQIAADDYPISKKEHGPDFLLEKRHLWLRSPKQWAIQRIRNSVINATY